MTAVEARKLTDESLQGPAIEELLVVARGRIESAARNGQRRLTDPFHGVKDWQNAAHQQAALQALRRDGFVVESHATPGDSRESSNYFSVSW